MEKIEERKIIPIAAMISAGKSLLLNMILNIKFLESKTDIGTKFVNILRYNPRIDKPKFYHLKIKEENGKYVFYKDPDFEPKIGEENIMEENKKINYMQQKANRVNYDNIFYMTEINSLGFLRDEQYMLTHDLCDIPGLSEYQEQIAIQKKDEQKKDEENGLKETIKKGEDFGLIDPKDSINNELKSKNENKGGEEDDIFYDLDIENESTYITEIYKRIKNYIDGAIIVLNVENYYFQLNIEIIAKLHKVIEKKIKNFLIILNKMDLSTNPSYDIESCRGFLFNSFPKCQTFNLNINTFIPISALQIQNELLMKDSFRHLLLYHFYNYKKLKKQEKLLNQTNNILNNNTFIDFLRNKLNEIQTFSKQQIEIKVDELNSRNNISKINDEIKSIIKELTINSIEDIELNIGIKENEVEEEDDEGEDFLSALSSQRRSSNKDNSINKISPIYIIKMFYILQKEQQYRPPYSKETEILLNYFRVKNDNDNENEDYDKEVDKIISNIELNKQIIKQLQLFYNEFKDSNNDLEQIQASNLLDKIQKLIECLISHCHCRILYFI